MSTSRDELVARFQKLYLGGDIDGVAVVAADSTRCESLRPVRRPDVHASTLPVVPVEGCTRTGGCRCRYEANFTVYE